MNKPEGYQERPARRERGERPERGERRPRPERGERRPRPEHRERTEEFHEDNNEPKDFSDALDKMDF